MLEKVFNKWKGLKTLMWLTFGWLLCSSPIKDINDVVELSVLDENGEKSPNFLGKVAIPLLTVSVKKTY